ncbi:protein PHOX1-like [Chenopodium quinoa]|uniref:protein PHOX1-like n=1 Tax=Chenopodium quinoa TaxID=63459 RepID=UPI000B78F78C|nr:protein PHOX1-like [Chenopodium quinoa]XP_021741841.1 protein PHOX1-like [Chenopodium quinoa]
MGKSSGKKKKQIGEKSGDLTQMQTRSVDNSPRAYDKDTEVFIAMAQELKDEGNRLFQGRDSEGALLKYEKAVKLLPRNHIDVAYLRSNMAACYMQMGISDYPRAVHECNLALEVTPKYSKALIKRARCYEGLNRLELALRDLNAVLSMEPNNLTALEIAERVKQTLESRGDRVFDHPLPEYIESPSAPASQPLSKAVKEKSRKKKNSKYEEGKAEGDGKCLEDILEKKTVNKKTVAVKEDKKSRSQEKKKALKNNVQTKAEDSQQREVEDLLEKKTEDKVVVEEKMSYANGDEPKNNVKLVFGEDIRWAQLPVNCSLLKLREVIQDRFPTSKAVLVKYKDHEGDMITITTSDELRLAEASAGPRGSVKIYIVEVSPEHDPFYEKIRGKDLSENGSCGGKKVKEQGTLCIEEWIVPFAQLFKNYVGFSSDAYLDLHELGVKLYSEAMEETICCEEAQVLFDIAAEKFQEMAALALFNWGNVHMARARKRVHFVEDSTQQNMLDQVKIAYDWAQQEYEKAGQKYEAALKIKPNFYEGHLALALQQFEQAKLAWYYAVANNDDLDTWSPNGVLDLYNKAEENIEKGVQMWEDSELQRQSSLSSLRNSHAKMQKMGFDRLFKDISTIDSEEMAMTISSQVNVLWGTMLYERSIMEFKLDLPVWHECLEVALGKFELAGASPTDIAVMVKNHCSNDSGVEGVGFRIDEIVQAWNEMDDAKRWYTGVPSFRLEPLLRRRVSKIYYALDQA